MSNHPVGLMPEPLMRFFDNNGNLLAGGKLYTYMPGRAGVLKPTYTDSTGTTENTNPVIMDSSGVPSNNSGNKVGLWLSGFYDIRLTDSNDVLVYSASNVSSTSTSSSAIDGVILVDATSGVQVTLPSYGGTTVVRTDASDTFTNPSLHILEILPPSGGTFFQGGRVFLYNQYETVQFTAQGLVYYKTSGTGVTPLGGFSNARTLAGGSTYTINVSEIDITLIRLAGGADPTVYPPTGYTFASGSSPFSLTTPNMPVRFVAVGTKYYIQ